MSAGGLAPRTIVRMLYFVEPNYLSVYRAEHNRNR